MKKFTHRFLGSLDDIKNLPASGGAIIASDMEEYEKNAKTASDNLSIDLKKDL